LQSKRTFFAGLRPEVLVHLPAAFWLAGVPLSRALVILCRERKQPGCRREWKQVHDAVIDGGFTGGSDEQVGRKLSTCLMWRMVGSRRSGACFLDIVLAQIAEFRHGKRTSLEGDCRDAVSGILLVLACGVLLVLMLFFIHNSRDVRANFRAPNCRFGDFSRRNHHWH